MSAGCEIESQGAGSPGPGLFKFDDQALRLEGIAHTDNVHEGPEFDTAMRTGDLVFRLPVPLVWRHDDLMLVGLVTAAEARRGAMLVRAWIPTPGEPGYNPHALNGVRLGVEHGAVRGFSTLTTAIPGAAQVTEAGEEGRQVKSGIRLWKHLALCPLGRNLRAYIFRATFPDGRILNFPPPTRATVEA